MRIPLSFAACALLLVSSNVAEAADPTSLAETNAYLLGNAHRCGVADDRVEHAGAVVRDLNTAELEAAKSRYVEIFSALAAPSHDRNGFPSCQVVIPQFERLERNHQQASLAY
jgi:hypothetical protein